jgi:hypothetical protein
MNVSRLTEVIYISADFRAFQSWLGQEAVGACESRRDDDGRFVRGTRLTNCVREPPDRFVSEYLADSGTADSTIDRCFKSTAAPDLWLNLATNSVLPEKRTLVIAWVSVRASWVTIATCLRRSPKSMMRVVRWLRRRAGEWRQLWCVARSNRAERGQAAREDGHRCSGRATAGNKGGVRLGRMMRSQSALASRNQIRHEPMRSGNFRCMGY